MRRRIRALRPLGRSALRRYRRIPRLLRWPLTAVALVVLAVVLANLLFGASAREVQRDFALGPGETVAMEVRVDAGRNVEVRWQPADQEAPYADATPLEAELSGPDLRLATTTASPEGIFRFKGGFAVATYRVQFANNTHGAPGRFVVRWTIH